VRPAAALLAPAAALLLAACAGGPAVPHPPDRPPAGEAAPPPADSAPFAELAARFTDSAIKRERAGELRQALEAWKVAAAVRPGAAEPKRRVADLAARLDAEAEQRYREGLARLRAGNIAGARREFLLALAANPDHAAALEALKNRLEPDAMPYTVAAGDTFAGIANKRYGDLAKAALVARANDLDPGGRPLPGSTLMLPSLTPRPAKTVPPPKKTPAPDEPLEPQDSAYDTEPSAIVREAPAAAPPAPAPGPAPPAIETPKPPDLAEEQLSRAMDHLQARRYEEAAAAADKLAGHPTVGPRAREVSGNAWFALGDAAFREERFADAIAAYRKAEPTRKDAATAIASVERRKKDKAEESYKEGVRLFIDQELDEAIRCWERTLALNPEHPTAPRDIEKARGLQQKLKDLR
jgi:tetratricopeptide (TPR) repeat protein